MQLSPGTTFGFIRNAIAMMLICAGVMSCALYEDGQPCESDNDCAPAQYCAHSGGVFFASAHCVQRSNPQASTDASAHDSESALDDLDTSPGTGPKDNNDATPPVRCSTNVDCNDELHCTIDTCVDGYCQHIPDDSLCDDDNVCTDNHCDANLGCLIENNTEPCDDDVFCNGPDTCNNGACTVHAGTTCSDGLCNESQKECAECFNDEECGEASEPVASACTFESVCASNGTRTVTTTTPRCQDNTCITTDQATTEACNRPMPSGSCGTVLQSVWSPCNFGSNVCATTGTQTRSITTPTCSNTSCEQIKTTETQNCTRQNPVNACQPDKITWGPCLSQYSCSSTGIQHKSITSWSCDAGECKSATFLNVESRSCSRNTDGLACTQGGLSGTCINNCCELNCPPGQQCLKCALQ